MYKATTLWVQLSDTLSGARWHRLGVWQTSPRVSLDEQEFVERLTTPVGARLRLGVLPSVARAHNLAFQPYDATLAAYADGMKVTSARIDIAIRNI